MRTDSIRALRGPNLWSDDTLLEVILLVDSDILTPAMLGSLRGAMTRDLAAMTQAIWDRSEASESHHGEATLIAELTAAFERVAGCEICPPSVHELVPGGKYRILVEYQEEEVGRRALKLACDLLAGVRTGQLVDLGAATGELRRFNQSVRLGPSTGAIVRAAEARGIPTRSHERHRRVHRAGQGADQIPARRGRRARARGPQRR
jgi:cyanophycin synthetase